MKTYTGNCHCKAINFTFNGPEIDDGMLCNCSICRRRGAVLSNFTIKPEDMEIQAEGQLLSTYQFGSKVAKHYFCNQCGVFTFVETRLNPGEYRVNLGCVDGINPFALQVEVYDGEDL